MYGELIRAGRAKRNWTQAQVAEAIGYSTGYYAHLEQEVKTPSWDLCMALANVFDFDDTELQALLDAVDETRARRAQARVRTRGRRVRELLKARSSVELAEAEQIAQDLANDPDLRVAYSYLKRVMTDRSMRATVIEALEAFAQTADE